MLKERLNTGDAGCTHAPSSLYPPAWPCRRRTPARSHCARHETSWPGTQLSTDLSPLKDASRIILSTPDGLGPAEMMRRTAKALPLISRRSLRGIVPRDRSTALLRRARRPGRLAGLATRPRAGRPRVGYCRASITQGSFVADAAFVCWSRRFLFH
jgi:hypothetical protein